MYKYQGELSRTKKWKIFIIYSCQQPSSEVRERWQYFCFGWTIPLKCFLETLERWCGMRVPQKRAEQTSGSPLVMTVAWRCVNVLTWTGWRPDLRPGCPMGRLGGEECNLYWSNQHDLYAAPLWVNNIWEGKREWHWGKVSPDELFWWIYG